MKKDSKIFVAGATGLVGGAIVRKLLDEGFTNIIGSYHSKDPSSIYPSHFTPHALRFTKIDLTRQKDTEEFFEKERPEYVFLAAAKVGGILANNTYKADFIYENIMIAANVIHASYKYGVKKLLNLGSSCIYPKFAPQPMKEEYLLTGLLEPTNEPYAIAKIAAIKLCRYYNEQYGTNFISVMPTNLYGPNDNFDLYTSHVLPALIRKFHLARCLEEDNWEALRKDLNRYPVEGVTGKSSKEEILNILAKYGITVHTSRFTPHESRVTVTLWGTGSPYREFLYVDDLADACIFLMKTLHALQLTPNGFINIGTGKDLKIKELAELIKEIVGFKGEIKWDTSKPDGTPRKLLDVSRLTKLGWQPKVSLEEGIVRTYQWYVGKWES